VRHVFVLCAIAALIVVAGCQKKADPAAEQSAVRSALDNYIRSIESEDINLYGEIFVHDPEMVNFGTGANERIVGWDALKKLIEEQNAALSDTKITQSDVTINLSPDGRFAWATSVWDFKATMDGEGMELPIRCSWVLEKGDNGWKFVHFHKSVGAAW
jgi:ketosteroid isomerase-like protein